MHRLAVLGGGPAGLGAAYRTARAGHDVVVVEAAPGPGGAAASFEVAGVRVDYGSHRMHPTIDPAVLAGIQELLGEDLQRRPRNGRIRLAGRWIAFPLRPADLVRRLPPGFALAAARDAAMGWSRSAHTDTFAQVLRARLGPAMCERFYFPYARKLWGLDPDEISGEQARKRVSADSPVKLAARALRGARGTGWFWYPRRGYGAISEALLDGARDAGADVRFETPARRVELHDDRAVIHTPAGRVESDIVWSTIPLPALVRLCDPPPGPEVLSAAAGLTHRAMVFVYLVLAVDRYSPYDAHYLPEPFTPVTRFSEPKNYRNGDDPAEVTVLCFEIPCEPGGDLYESADDDLAGVALDCLRDAQLPRPPVSDVVVRRMRHVYPVYRVGFERALETLDDWATAQPRLLTFGRQGLFVHDNTHHTLAMAWAAAEALGPAGQFDSEAWSRARRGFAAHVVED